MRKLLLVSSIFLFIFFTFFSPLSSQVLETSAQEKSTKQEVESEDKMDRDTIDSENEDEATVAAKVEYTLAYPGILPDNPLYFLKALRDRLVGILISDPQKKAEFNLLTSDKRARASLMLADQDKDELAVSTLSKSNNYLEQAISSAAQARASGKNVDTVLSNLKNSIRKHEEVSTTVGKKADKKFSAQLQKEHKRLVEFAKAVDKLLPQK